MKFAHETDHELTYLSLIAHPRQAYVENISFVGHRWSLCRHTAVMSSPEGRYEQ